MKTIIGLFGSATAAQGAVDRLRAAGWLPDEISVVLRDAEASACTAHCPEGGSGLAAGALGGAFVGGLGGLLAGLGLLAVGPIAATIGGAALGGATGGMLGLLVEHGISQKEARLYQIAVENGAILVAVHTNEDRADAARAILEAEGSGGPHPWAAHEARA